MVIKIGSIEISEEQKYRLISEFTYDWEEWRGPVGEILYVSPACARITGYPTQNFLSDPNFLASIIHPNDLEIYQNHRKESLNAKMETSKLDFRIIHRNGKERWINHYCVPVFLDDGTWIGRRESNRDITELKRVQAELQNSRDELEKRVEERTKDLEEINQSLINEISIRKKIELALQSERDFSNSLVQTAQAGLLVLDVDGKVLQINPFLEQLSGYTLEEVFQKDWFKTFLLPQDQQPTRHLFNGAVKDFPTRGNITPIKTKKGEIRFVEWHDKTLKDEQGQTTGLLAIGLDVTERKKIEEKLVRNAAQSEAMANITSRLNAELDLKAVLNSICEELVRALPAMQTSIIMLKSEGEQGYLHYAAGYGLNLNLQDQLKPVPASIYLADLSRNGTFYVIPDVKELNTIVNIDIVDIIQIRTVIVLYMLHQEKIIGSIYLTSLGEPYSPTHEELSFVKTLASHATIAITNARLFEQVSDNKQRLQSLSQRLVKIQESERRNIARELHDEIGQELTSLILLLEVIKNTCHIDMSPSEATSQKIENAQDLVNVLLKQIRELALDLRPGMLDDLGLMPALIMHFDRFFEQTGIRVIFKHRNIAKRFSGEIETTAFRIIQEALTNVARHAKVKQVQVRLWVEENKMMIQVQDDGAGFDLDEKLVHNKSIGLIGMQERATLCGGSIEIDTQPGVGTCLSVELPLADHTQDRI